MSRRYVKAALSGCLAGWLLASALLLVPAAALGQEAALASSRIPPQRLEAYSDLAVQWLQLYLQVDTTNPPGSEARAAAFFKKILDAEGIENQVFESAPGRGNIWARVRGDGSRRPIILLNHMDVVTSDASRWKYPPFSGAIAGGVMYGRGAQDMKCEGLAQLMVLVMLHREHAALSRDVIFLGTADEEVNDSGSDWVIANHPELLGHAEYLLTEGGENMLAGGKVKYVGVDAAEKSPFWLHVVARGRAGHGSRPIAGSAPDRLVAALERILAYHTEFQVIPTVDEFLKNMARFESGKRAQQFADVRQALKDPGFRAEIEQNESLNYMLRDTISLTMLGGSRQTNVIPGEAWANLDVRLLPGEVPAAFLETIRKVVNDPAVTVEPLNESFQEPNSSPTGTELFAAIRRAAAAWYPSAVVTPLLTSGYNENQRYRKLGIVGYGFTPYTATAEEMASEHSDNERIRVEEVRRGYRVLYDVLLQVAGMR